MMKIHFSQSLQLTQASWKSNEKIELIRQDKEKPLREKAFTVTCQIRLFIFKSTFHYTNIIIFINSINNFFN